MNIEQLKKHYSDKVNNEVILVTSKGYISTESIKAIEQLAMSAFDWGFQAALHAEIDQKERAAMVARAEQIIKSRVY